jgi:hypothetical protein
MIEYPEITKDKLLKAIGSRWWRLNNLYYIIDENSKKILFHPNEVQKKLYDDRWYRNVILKSRQHGITTFISILFLDDVLFNRHRSASIIAHKRTDAAKIFSNKIVFAYENMPKEIREQIPVIVDRSDELQFANGSRIIVSTSTRSGTVNLLHVSELGKLAMAYPEKAREVISGSFPSVHVGEGRNNMLFVESTADGGASGEFFDICKPAMDLQQSNAKLTPLDFKFHFFGWYQDKKNVIDPTNVIVSERLDSYFTGLEEKSKITLTPSQKAWYVKSDETLGDEVRIQYPSTPEEAFAASIEGSFYREQLLRARSEGRIGKVPVQSGVYVNTAWDIGISDATAVWFYQIIGRELHIVDFYEQADKEIDHFIMEVLMKKGYKYGEHIAPHDIAARDQFNHGLSRIESAYRDFGIVFRQCPKIGKQDGIDIVRRMLSITHFDEDHCGEGLEKLEGYHKEWDRKHGIFKNAPVHSKESNAADAFRYLCVWHAMRMNLYKLREDGSPIIHRTKKAYSYI